MSKLKRRDNSSGKNYKNYIGNKNEGHGFINKQRERVSFQYKKLRRKEDRKERYLAKQTSNFPETERPSESNPNFSPQRQQKNKIFHTKKLQDTQKKSDKHVFKKLHEDAENKKKEKEKKREELLIKQREREEALEKYKERRQENYRKLSKKTKRGQPVMKYQMDFLLDKIEKSVRRT